MTKIIAALLLITFSVQSFSQTCAQKLMLTKKSSYVDRLDERGRHLVGFAGTAGGLTIGIAVAGVTFPGFLIAVGVASAPILAGEAIKGIQNRPINRMIKLIKQSEALVANPGLKPGRLLRRLQKKLSSEKLEITSLELATAISLANKDPKQCGSIYRIKHLREEIDSGRLPVIDLDEDDSTSAHL